MEEKWKERRRKKNSQGPARHRWRQFWFDEYYCFGFLVFGRKKMILFTCLDWFVSFWCFCVRSEKREFNFHVPSHNGFHIFGFFFFVSPLYRFNFFNFSFVYLSIQCLLYFDDRIGFISIKETKFNVMC